MNIRVFFKKLQIYDKNKPVHYVGTNPSSLQVIDGLIPNNEWIEFTNDIEGVEKLNLRWELKRESVGKGTSNIEKASSDEMTVTNKAYLFVKEWLNDSVSAPLNGIEVKLEIDGGGIFSGFVIKNDGITYCDSDLCRMDIMLKQKDDIYSCIQTTLITDNHSGMFSGSYQHPRMAYCNDLKPSWLLSVLMQINAIQGAINAIMYMSIYPVLKHIISVVNLFRRKKIKLKDPGEMRDEFVQIMFKATGCGREHPAPLIRDYISNVCAKCGVTVTPYTVPIFFDPSSEYYNLVMLTAESKEGMVDRYADNFWIDDNKPILTLDMLLNELNSVFNAKWYIKNNTLYFGRKDFDEHKEYLYDFINNDRGLIIDGICYSWNETKKKAYARTGYAVDSFDSNTNDTKSRFNDIVEYNNPVNPLLEGVDNRTINYFSATRFRNDGLSDDYISQALRASWIVSTITLGLTEIMLYPLREKLNGKKGAIILQNDTITMPRLLIWDGKSKTNAKVKYQYEYNGNLPLPNPLYNKEGKSYSDLHNEDEKVDKHYNEPNKLYNYAMAFDANFLGNLYDRFHQIDDPRVTPPMNKKFELKIALCMPDLKRLGLFDDASNIGLGRRVKLNAGQYYKEGIIEEIEISFDPTDKLGRWIKIKGTL